MKNANNFWEYLGVIPKLNYLVEGGGVGQVLRGRASNSLEASLIKVSIKRLSADIFHKKLRGKPKRGYSKIVWGFKIFLKKGRSYLVVFLEVR